MLETLRNIFRRKVREVDCQPALAIVRLVKRLNESQGQTFIVVTHDPMVSREARRILRLHDGRIEGDTGAAFESPQGQG